MNWSNHKKKTLAGLALGLVVLTGTFNAIVINSESNLSTYDAKLVKRLDEVYGIVTPGRATASVSWQKLQKTELPQIKKIPAPELQNTVSHNQVAHTNPGEVKAALQEELTLNLIEVANPKKWEKGLSAAQFSGSIATKNGVIESLSAQLPNGEGLSVSFSELIGNVFEYELNGELYSGMMYQVDETSYMVTLSNGPLEGTRMRFVGSAPQDEEQTQANIELAENHNIEVGNFGEVQAAPQVEVAQENLEASPEMQIQTQAFNFDQQTM